MSNRGGRGGFSGPRVPRPGDWKCKCGQNNFARNNECYKCQAPKPAGAGSGQQQARRDSSSTVSSRGGGSGGYNQGQSSSARGGNSGNRGGRGGFQGGGGSRGGGYHGSIENKLGPIDLTVNYYPIILNNLIDTVYMYDVSLDPDATKKLFIIAVDTFMKKNFAKVDYAYDGRKIMYTNQKLPLETDAFDAGVTAVLGDRSREYKVTVKFTTEIDMRPLKSKDFTSLDMDSKPSNAIQALNVIIRRVFLKMILNEGAVSCGSSIYTPNKRKTLQNSYWDKNTQQKVFYDMPYELWYGYFQSVVMCENSLYLNIDALHKAFPREMSLIEVIDYYRWNMSNEFKQKKNMDQVVEHLKRLDIEYKGKKYQFKKFAGTAAQETFEQDGRKVTVLQYLKNNGEQLKYPNAPLVELGQKGMCVPIEMCIIPGGQATNKKTTKEVTSTMVTLCATSVEVRKAKITELFGNLKYDDVLKNFGIKITQKFEYVQGEVIAPPKLQYANGIVEPKNGSWTGLSFLTPAKVPEGTIRWAVISCNAQVEKNSKMLDLKDIIVRGFKAKGINIADEPRFDFSDKTIKFDEYNKSAMKKFDEELEKLLNKCKSENCRIVFVVLAQQDTACHARVKTIADTKVGIMTQCLKSATVLYKMDKDVIDNIIKKDNAKLNGINQEIIDEIFQKHKGMMFIGADVTHAGPDSNIPSIVGVTSSYDANGFRYCGNGSMQRKEKERGAGPERRQVEEMIMGLEDIVVKHVKKYQEYNKKLPEKILYYRDGVSEGQFDQVLNIELTAIRAAVDKLVLQSSGTVKPKITFIVVQKRHRARFFPVDPKMKNVPPGTVVDKKVVDPITDQYYLTSHQAPQGVAKPSKYCTLEDESNFDKKDLERITYDMCHVFARCDRSVSYPAPTYYAHLLAARGREYIRGSEDEIMRNCNSNAKLKEYYEKNIQNAIATAFTNNYPMFFI